MLRGSITQREKEKAERATLVQQERLIRGGVCLLPFCCSHVIFLRFNAGNLVESSAHFSIMPRLDYRECTPMSND